MFAASHNFAFFDYFRVPYAIRAGNAPPSAAVGQLRLAARDSRGHQPGPQLYWKRADHKARARPGRYQLADFTFFGQVAPDEAVPGILAGISHGWRPVTPIHDAAGRAVAAIWQDSRRNVFLPFDPAEI